MPQLPVNDPGNLHRSYFSASDLEKEEVPLPEGFMMPAMDQ